MSAIDFCADVDKVVDADGVTRVKITLLGKWFVISSSTVCVGSLLTVRFVQVALQEVLSANIALIRDWKSMKLVTIYQILCYSETSEE